MTEWIILGIVGLLSGVCASLGIGGGFVLLLYLTVLAGIPQLEAQLINLIFFLPVAAVSLIIHFRHKLIDWKAVGFTVAGGLIGVFPGVWIASALSNDWLSKLFAVFILLIGLKELFSKPPKNSIPA